MTDDDSAINFIHSISFCSLSSADRMCKHKTIVIVFHFFEPIKEREKWNHLFTNGTSLLGTYFHGLCSLFLYHFVHFFHLWMECMELHDFEWKKNKRFQLSAWAECAVLVVQKKMTPWFIQKTKSKKIRIKDFSSTETVCTLFNEISLATDSQATSENMPPKKEYYTKSKVHFIQIYTRKQPSKCGWLLIFVLFSICWWHISIVSKWQQPLIFATCAQLVWHWRIHGKSFASFPMMFAFTL